MPSIDTAVSILGFLFGVILAASFIVAYNAISYARARRRFRERGRQMVIAETIAHHRALREAQQAALRA